METLTTRAGMWFALLVLAIMAAALSRDAAFGIHMSIVAIAVAIALWWTLAKTKVDTAGTWLRAPHDEGAYDDDPIRWGVIATLFWGIAGFAAGLFIAK